MKWISKHNEIKLKINKTYLKNSKHLQIKQYSCKEFIGSRKISHRNNLKNSGLNESNKTAHKNLWDIAKTLLLGNL